MRETGTPKQVLTKKAQKTKKGATYDDLIKTPKYATIAKRSEKANSSSWGNHVKKHATKYKLTYAASLADPRCKNTYTKVVKVKKEKTPSVPSTKTDSVS